MNNLQYVNFANHPRSETNATWELKEEDCHFIACARMINKERGSFVDRVCESTVVGRIRIQPRCVQVLCMCTHALCAKRA